MTSQPHCLNHNQRVSSELTNSDETPSSINAPSVNSQIAQPQSIQTSSNVGKEHLETNSKGSIVSQLLNILQLTLTPQPPALPTVLILVGILLIAILPRLTPSDRNFELNIKISPGSNQVEKATTPK
jgi:hypothetical protein